MRKSKSTSTTRPVARGYISALALVGLSMLSVFPVNGAIGYTGDPIDLELEDAGLRDVLQTFGALSGLRVVLDPRAVPSGSLDDPLTLFARDRPWDEVLDGMLTSRGLTATREGSLLWILPLGEIMAEDRAFSGESINLDLRDADLVEVLASFSKISGTPIICEPGVGGSVSLTISDTPWDQVLDLILCITGHGYTSDGGEIRVFVVPGGAAAELLPPGWPKQRPLRITGDGDRIYRYRVGGPISKPQRISGPDPVYPAELKDAGTTGIVILEAVITRDGSVQSLAVVDGSAPPAMVEAASDAVRQWRFTPAIMDGDPVTAEYVLTVRFTPEMPERR